MSTKLLFSTDYFFQLIQLDQSTTWTVQKFDILNRGKPRVNALA